ncbi:predicted protein [Uncinocarpus reesii 1704]|uniref:Uncharacterized protein n=1 Tax=Uncinocarpus reesii (strain UAMH 1704) TaxID=336963 RepID=C4JV13_UNCRE|nr:uncharacterized protein UREG_04966 [Uncinocarpus reesii 1704]EEP80124.1 predicted protein [Uncinocarpus reesii 1704]
MLDPAVDAFGWIDFSKITNDEDSQKVPTTKRDLQRILKLENQEEWVHWLQSELVKPFWVELWDSYLSKRNSTERSVGLGEIQAIILGESGDAQYRSLYPNKNKIVWGLKGYQTQIDSPSYIATSTGGIAIFGTIHPIIGHRTLPTTDPKKSEANKTEIIIGESSGGPRGSGASEASEANEVIEGVESVGDVEELTAGEVLVYTKIPEATKGDITGPGIEAWSKDLHFKAEQD